MIGNVVSLKHIYCIYLKRNTDNIVRDTGVLRKRGKCIAFIFKSLTLFDLKALLKPTDSLLDKPLWHTVEFIRIPVVDKHKKKYIILEILEGLPPKNCPKQQWCLSSVPLWMRFAVEKRQGTSVFICIGTSEAVSLWIVCMRTKVCILLSKWGLFWEVRTSFKVWVRVWLFGMVRVIG